MFAGTRHHGEEVSMVQEILLTQYMKPLTSSDLTFRLGRNSCRSSRLRIHIDDIRSALLGIVSRRGSICSRYKEALSVTDAKGIPDIGNDVEI